MRRICESLNKVFKILLKILTGFKKILIKIWKKIDETINFLLLSILIAGWGEGCSPSFANFRGFGGEASPFPLATPLVLINIYFLHGSILCLILLIETKFDYIFQKFLLKLVYSFKFSSFQIWTMCAQVKSFLTLRLCLFETLLYSV